ncbi:ribonuclease T2 [Paracoccus sp. (in: a-proteobacteria)]|uniref:ribonuclease T2 n=1 Tax=Paracoccus sp. TaxID=267 RepID=UPI0026DED6F4|nr:ribonuclease T2 [Paracoccus sp. (in: a-proteobacteria)]MDO5647328.1 ribonuclease T2 [Paracoccus sp. (in: a-proteobacteria)]
MKACLAALCLALPAPLAARDVAGQFDYYVLALSWSPAWCDRTGDARNAPECRRGSGLGFTVHGLWPQYEQGWPEYCTTPERDPARRESQAMADIMGSGGLAWYQWQKHGRCTGLSARGYYDTTRQAWDAVNIPDVLQALTRNITLPPNVIEAAFLESNPDMSPDGVTVTCSGDALQEVRICLTRDLHPRDCAPDTRRDCPRPRVSMPGMR